jgi:hypothetical protein
MVCACGVRASTVPADAAKVRATLEKLRNLNVLTVGETGAFLKDGGMVALVNTGEQVQIQINVDTAHDAKFKISSRLLNIAKLVHSAGEAAD